MSPISLVLDRLGESGRKVIRRASGWTCQCPAHEDQKPSLSVSEGYCGRALLHCHAGCDTEDVVAALGLGMSDLTDRDSVPFGGATYRTSVHGRSRGDSLVQTRTRARFDTSNDALAALRKMLGEPTGSWVYEDSSGRPVMLVARWDRRDGKTFRPISRTDSGWVIAGMEGPAPLYHLPDVTGATKVFVCEGEKAADAARTLGLIATTTPSGSSSAHKADWSPVQGKRVVVLPDNDDAGDSYAAACADLALKAGATDVRIVSLVSGWPDLPPGGDMADLIDERALAPAEVRARVDSLVDAATPARRAPVVNVRPPFPVHVFPSPLREYVLDGAASIGCDPSFVALPLLAALAGAIGGSRSVELKRGWVEPAVIWGAVVGEPGTAKSPAIELALRPLLKLQQRLEEQHKGRLADYERQQTLYERELSEWKKADGGTDPPLAPDRPTMPRLVVNDITIEAVASVLERNPRGLLAHRDELSSLICGFDRYSGARGAEVGQWLSMFNATRLSVDRKARDPIVIPFAPVGIIGGVQPKTLRRVMRGEHTENGFLARFLFVRPPRVAKRWTDQVVSAKVEEDVQALFEGLLSMQPSIDGGPVRLPLSKDALGLFRKFDNAHLAEQAELEEDLAAMWSKHEAYVARLAMILSVARAIAAGRKVGPGFSVESESVRGGVQLIEWFGGEARRVLSELSETERESNERELVALIHRRGCSVTPRELVQLRKKEYPRVQDARQVLDRLVESGQVTRQQIGGGRSGRPSTRYILAG